jgi:hypothetical protein
MLEQDRGNEGDGSSGNETPKNPDNHESAWNGTGCLRVLNREEGMLDISEKCSSQMQAHDHRPYRIAERLRFDDQNPQQQSPVIFSETFLIHDPDAPDAFEERLDFTQPDG